jgi:hypothetical protein
MGSELICVSEEGLGSTFIVKMDKSNEPVGRKKQVTLENTN